MYIYGLPWWLRQYRICLQCRRLRFDPWVGRSSGDGNGNPLQYSCLENPMDSGAWWVTIHRVAIGHNWALDTTEQHTHTHTRTYVYSSSNYFLLQVITVWFPVLYSSSCLLFTEGPFLKREMSGTCLRQHLGLACWACDLCSPTGLHVQEGPAIILMPCSHCLETIILSLNLCFVSEAQGDNDTCMWTEEVNTKCMFSVYRLTCL